MFPEAPNAVGSVKARKAELVGAVVEVPVIAETLALGGERPVHRNIAFSAVVALSIALFARVVALLAIEGL